jgi:hypothetical protein
MKIIDIPQSGKCGLTVNYSGRNGQVRRAWTPGTNNQLPAQMTVRSALSAQAAAFKVMTQADQNVWIAAAAQYQTKTRLGSSGPLTGLQLFVKLNTALTLIGQPALAAPTTRPAFGPLAPQNLVITNAAGLISMKLTCPEDPGTNTVLCVAKPCSTGVRRPPLMVVAGIVPAPVLGSSDIMALYTSKYGNPPVGSQVFVSCFQITDGWESLRTTFSALVPASA